MTEKKRKRKKIEALPDVNRALYAMFFTMDKVDLFNFEEVKARTESYMEFCNQNNIAPLWTDYSFALGYNRIYLTDVLHGTSKTNHPVKVRELLEKVHLWLEASLAQYGLQHPEASVMTIWLQKNNFGYKDTFDLQVNRGLPVVEDGRMQLEEIKRRYQYIIDSVPDAQPGDIPEGMTEQDR